MMQLGMYNVITQDDDIYPDELRELVRPPEQLYCFGDLSLLSKRKAGVVGSRKVSSYGKWVAMTAGEKISKAGIVVVSGMAKGIDSYAHQGALKGKGKTIAVLGCGIDKCYPVENWKLKDAIAHEGLVISEYPPGAEAARWTFPERNRIIAALSEMLVVAEAGLNSGALITAELAVDLGKTVMAIPGNINNAYNIGSNKLISEGAMPVVVMDDILQTLGVSDEEILVDINLGKAEKEVLELVVKYGEVSVEKMCMLLDKKPAQINGIVSVLEMKGIVYTSMGKVFVAK